MEILVAILAALATLLVPLVLVMAEVAVLGASALVELALFVWQLIATGSVDAARAARRSSARRRRGCGGGHGGSWPRLRGRWP